LDALSNGGSSLLLKEKEKQGFLFKGVGEPDVLNKLVEGKIL